jgi:hypothetical protein
MRAAIVAHFPIETQYRALTAPGAEPFLGQESGPMSSAVTTVIFSLVSVSLVSLTDGRAHAARMRASAVYVRLGHQEPSGGPSVST